MSVYERREFGWRDRLARLISLEEPPAPPCEPLRLVVERGHPVGYRCEDGSVLRFPERRIEEIPDSEWTWVGGEWRRRWRE